MACNAVERETHEVISYGIASCAVSTASSVMHISRDLHHQNHLLFQFPIVIILRTDFPVEMQQLLQGLVFGWHDILDHRHQQLRLFKFRP